MKDLVSKETAVACQRGSEKLRFGTKISLLTRVKLPDRKTLRGRRLRRCPFVRANSELPSRSRLISNCCHHSRWL